MTFRATSGMSRGAKRLETEDGPRDTGSNPRASMSMRYVFAPSRGAAKLPFAGVTRVRTWPAASVRVTRAPATPSEASRTPSRFTSRNTKPVDTVRRWRGRSKAVESVNVLRSWNALDPRIAWTS